MTMRRAAIILATTIVVLVGGTAVYLEVSGVNVLDLITARQTPPLPPGSGDDLAPGVRPPTHPSRPTGSLAGSRSGRPPLARP